MRVRMMLGAAVVALALASCGNDDKTAGAPGSVTHEKLVAAPSDTANWLTTGRTYDEQRFTPLDQINASNVGKLGLAWFHDLDSNRGQEATPIVVDGKLYASTAWSMVKAFDAKTGKLLWAYDPQVPRETLVKSCCDAVNRGVAVWQDKVYVGTLDGRLVALDAKSGKPVWSQVTVDQSKPYTITGAPRVIEGKVIIGNGGAEFGVRGYATAYDADSGKQLWRFYTVPGNPTQPFEGEYLRKAAATWHGEWWKLGGGGTVWDSMAYDPELDLLYIGVGNGSPWNQRYRSPGGGDNLYLSSIVALKPDTGEYVWHYQTTPGETWDFTATQHIVLADLAIGGRTRKVLMQAPKNGFFYVIDRETGKLLSAKNFVNINWASGVDLKTGRPIENPAARYDKTGKPFVVVPGAAGAHSWHPMSFSPKTGLVYIPAQDAGLPYIPDPNWKPAKLGFNNGIDMAAAAMPADAKLREGFRGATKGALIAWDPVAQKEVWRVQYKGPWNGGLLSTGGNLVFQGNAAGEFAAYRADSGVRLWSMPVQTGVVAAPITYMVDGEQYVAVLAGWGGIWALAPGALSNISGPTRNVSRLLVFKLGGTAKLPDLPPLDEMPLDPPPATAPAAVVAEGAKHFGRFCSTCHGDAGIAGGLVPDLRYSGLLNDPESWRTVVIDGALKENGMVSFAPVLNPAQADAIRSYVIKRANEDRAIEAAAKAQANKRPPSDSRDGGRTPADADQPATGEAASSKRSG